MPSDQDLMQHGPSSNDDSGDESRRGKPTMKEVAACFHLPIEVAAKQLGVGQTWLKLLCRSNGVSRWPFRKIQSLQNSLDRSKKMQSLVEVAKVINKNLPKWLDLESDNPQVDIPADAVESPIEDNEDGDDAPAGVRAPTSVRPTEPLQEALRPRATAPVSSWKMPDKRDEEYNLQIQVLEQERGSAPPQAPSTAGEEPSIKQERTDAPANQWQRVLQDAISKQHTDNSGRAQSPAGFGSKSGGAFRPVPQKAVAPAIARMPAPIDFSHFYQFPNATATHLLPYLSDQFPAAFATAFANQGRPLNPLGLAPSTGLEQLLAVAATQPALSQEQIAEMRRV
mmetsp:Transcript_16824/g.47023  ORF Transcript_16824/g.47023 Transcript_16824/m.47023 type:complete len:339 (+) Transcript_16824:477-1493(+)|eukprot:CAMPEP_0117648248 /NCGR_PEP_ID=MMETSP0804-20121206/291_1 /TAXON_ID=1074897 /ORGANISM="Tetraselmis astigmatica, Strain CCMP880" /LENGTH=338 /DNA_ID=CAMNT_0005453813 /DNA_START=403 /DNA_END=1419 /DNA_ORIENTATION=+